MGFLEVLTLIFIALKLFGVIAWSWWLVLLPVIISAAIYVIILATVGVGFFTALRKFDDFD
ncbi:hypothetical protein [Oceanobacillus sojae]|uniref:hypothetical protein n=1 Tax=Oceanobacillus sojae TaxID=582851 RepID=UPI00098880D6|nr:hypothetical protein [Oceanobacillus sojae]